MHTPTPREIEKKKSNFKLFFSVIISNLFIFLIFLFLKDDNKAALKNILPNNHVSIILTSYSTVDEKNSFIIISDERGNLVADKAILLEQYEKGDPPKYKVAIHRDKVQKLTKYINKPLYLHPYIKRQTRTQFQKANYEINF